MNARAIAVIGLPNSEGADRDLLVPVIQLLQRRHGEHPENCSYCSKLALIADTIDRCFPPPTIGSSDA